MLPYTFIREVPEQLRLGVSLGHYAVDGSIIRDVLSGRIVAHLQSTSSVLGHLSHAILPLDPVNSLLSSIDIVQNIKVLEGVEWLTGAMQTQLGMTGGNLLLSGFAIIQNEQIKSRLGDISDSLVLVQGLQVAEMLMSGLGIGAGILSQLAMRRRLASIGEGIAGLGERLDHVQEADRRRRIGLLFRQLDEQVAVGESLAARRRPDFAAAAAEAQLTGLIAGLSEEFESRIDDLPTERAAAATAVAEANGIAKAIQLGRQVQLQALLEVDEPEAAFHLAQHQSGEASRQARLLDPASLLVRTEEKYKDTTSAEAAVRSLIGQVVLLVGDLKTAARSTLGTGLLADCIGRNGWSSRAYLAEARLSDGPPIMMVSSEDPPCGEAFG